ncbi:MAG: AAA family ATPase [Sphingobacteriia bacterium]|nr:AAA family ATPase [Sphingobacteriia bacterium]
MIILIGNEKGGVGKSTLAINLAVARALKGKDILLVDTDKQRSSLTFLKIRQRIKELPRIHMAEHSGDIYETLKDLSSRYEEIIVDAGGSDSIELRTAMIAADKMIIPLKASQIDNWAIAQMNALVADVKKRANRDLQAYSVISMAPTNPVITEEEDTKLNLQDYSQIPLLKTVIRERKIYRDSIIEGKGVLELEVSNKAKSEIKELEKEVFEKVMESVNE